MNIVFFMNFDWNTATIIHNGDFIIFLKGGFSKLDSQCMTHTNLAYIDFDQGLVRISDFVISCVDNNFIIDFVQGGDEIDF